MMTFEQLMDEFEDQFNDEIMDDLTCEVNYFVEEVRKKEPQMVEKFLMKVDLLLNPHFTKESAEYAVHCMKNKDGSTGEHWNYETTSKVLESKGYNFNEADWYYTLNMIHSDYYKDNKSTDSYVELAEDFLNDPDGPKDKAKKYYLAMKKSY